MHHSRKALIHIKTQAVVHFGAAHNTGVRTLLVSKVLNSIYNAASERKSEMCVSWAVRGNEYSDSYKLAVCFSCVCVCVCTKACWCRLQSQVCGELPPVTVEMSSQSQPRGGAWPSDREHRESGKRCSLGASGAPTSFLGPGVGAERLCNLGPFSPSKHISPGELLGGQ